MPAIYSYLLLRMKLFEYKAVVYLIGYFVNGVCSILLHTSEYRIVANR